MKSFFSNKLFIAIVILLVKILVYILFLANDQKHQIIGYIFLDSPDRTEYLTPIDNLIEHGTYATQINSAPYAGRLPGFIFPYIIFRALFKEPTAVFLLGTFILLFSVFAALLLWQLILSLTNSIKLAWIGIFCVQLIPYYWHWDWSIHPNSLAASCTILLVYFLCSFYTKLRLSQLFYSGFFLTWLFMLRGVTIFLIPALILWLVLFAFKNELPFAKIVVFVLIFTSSLLLAESLWVGRNMISLGRFIPLQTYFVPGAKHDTSYAYGSKTKLSLMKLREYINCWGGDNFWYFDRSEFKWFVEPGSVEVPQNYFRSIVFSGTVTAQKLSQLKEDILFSFLPELSKNEHDSIEERISRTCEQFRSEFMRNNSSYFYFVAPFNRIGNLLLRNTTQDWPGLSFAQLNLIGKLMKLASLVFYSLGLILFLLIIIFKFREVFHNKFYFLLSLFPLTIILTFAFAINAAHYCYFIYGYIPMMILVISVISDNIRRRTHDSSLASIRNGN